MRPVVVVTNRVHDAALRFLESRCEVVANRDREPWPDQVLAENLGRADGVVAFMPDHIDEAVLARAPRLRIVSCCLKGCDNFDVEACGRVTVV